MSVLSRLRNVFLVTKTDHSALYAFLPAAIELEHTPSSKAGRAIIWLIAFLFLIALLWATFGKIDIVAVAQGKVIPTEAVKQIQSLETARIKAIHVKEGLRVQQGQVLIELDSLLAKAELDTLKAEQAGVEQNLQRLRKLSAFLSSADISMRFGESVVRQQASQQRELDSPHHSQRQLSQQLPHQLPGQLALQQAQLQQEKSEVSAQLVNFENERIKLQAEQKMVQAEISKKQQVLPVLQERVNALDILRKKSYGSKLQYLELKQTLIEQQQDLAVQQVRREQLIQSEGSVSAQQALYLADKRKQTLAERNALQVQFDALAQQVLKAEQRLQHFTLVAPISGEVQQLMVHTVDGVVQSAQTLMQIVPSDSSLEVEAMILNKDIGFVEEGQTVAVKIDTFNFTKYGLIEAELVSISDDAISQNTTTETPGLVYRARVKLNKDSLLVEGRDLRLQPGMSVTAEIKTGQRRLIEFFLSPLLRYKQESLGER
jgi:hemolysin D